MIILSYVVLVKISYASDQIDTQRLTSATCDATSTSRIIYVPNHWNISGVSLYGATEATSTEVSVNFDIYDEWDILIGTKYFTASDSYFPKWPSSSEYHFDFLQENNYNASTTKKVIITYTTDPASDYVCIIQATGKLWYKIWYEDTLDYWTYNPPPFTTDTYGIETVNSQLCFTNEQCNLWFSFNDNAIDNKVYAVPDVQYQQNPTYAIGSTTVVEIMGMQNAIVLPTQTEEIRQQLCLYLEDIDDDDFGDELSNCGIGIIWRDRESWREQVYLQTGIATQSRETLVDEACNDLATTTWVFWDPTTWAGGMGYAIECGLRKVAIWAFHPSDEALQSIYNNTAKLTSGFPVNIGTAVYNIINDDRTTTTTLQAFPLVYSANGEEMAYLFDADQFYNSTETEQSFFENMREWIGNFLWLVFLFYIIMRIFMISQKDKEPI